MPNCTIYIQITMVILTKFVAFIDHYPVVRGMLSYAVIWPSSSIIQQTISGRTVDDYDWKQALRFSIFGTFYVAPTLYCWIRISSRLWPAQNLKTALIKASIEQFTYGPFANVSFFMGMSLLEGKNIDGGIEQVEAKFWPTYKAALAVWPAFQTFNFCFIPEKHRVPSVSVFSMVWCCFLAYMHQLNMKTQTKPS